MMTLEEIEKRLTEIEDCSGDCESAHAQEDLLMEDFIKHVAEVGTAELAEKARAVLRSAEIKFSRWYA
jgi:hypothetical protein